MEAGAVKRRWPPKEPRSAAPRPDGDQPYILRRPPASLSNVAERRVTTILDQIIATLDLDEGAVKDAFTAFVERHYQTLRAPRRPHEIWPQLSDTIFSAG